MADPEHSGCKNTQKCVRIDDENAKCDCLIPIDERLTESNCQCAEGSFLDGHCVQTCESSDDCSGSKCVFLPGYNHKTCLCPIHK